MTGKDDLFASTGYKLMPEVECWYTIKKIFQKCMREQRHTECVSLPSDSRGFLCRRAPDSQC